MLFKSKVIKTYTFAKLNNFSVFTNINFNLWKNSTKINKILIHILKRISLIFGTLNYFFLKSFITLSKYVFFQMFLKSNFKLQSIKSNQHIYSTNKKNIKISTNVEYFLKVLVLHNFWSFLIFCTAFSELQSFSSIWFAHKSCVSSCFASFVRYDWRLSKDCKQMMEFPA